MSSVIDPQSLIAGMFLGWSVTKLLMVLYNKFKSEEVVKEEEEKEIIFKKYTIACGARTVKFFVSKDGNFAFTTSQYDEDLHFYDRNPITGILSEIKDKERLVNLKEITAEFRKSL